MEPKLKAEPRDKTGESANRKLRQNGKVPAVLYGREVQNLNLQVNRNQARSLLQTGAINNVLVELEVEGEDDPREVLIKDVDLHPVESHLVHLDFHQVSPDDDVQVKVPIHLVGESVGVEEEDGIVDQPLRFVQVDCKASNIPESMDVDISELGIGDALFVGDIDLPPGVRVLEDDDRTVVSVQPPEEFEVEPEPAAEAEEIAETVEEAMEEVVEGEEIPEGEEVPEGEAPEGAPPGAAPGAAPGAGPGEEAEEGEEEEYEIS